jgi:hypothetical protein
MFLVRLYFSILITILTILLVLIFFIILVILIFQSVVDGSGGRALSISHEGPQLKSRHGHLLFSLFICDLTDC